MTNKTKWSMDQAHCEIAFKVGRLMVAHINGTFKTFDASVYTKLKDFTTAEIDFWIDASSITTGDAKRDEHLRSSDFFDVKKYKQITFTSRTIGKSDSNGNHDLWGELTIKGVTKNVKLMVQFGGILNDPWGYEKAEFTVSGKINRSDWGLIWNASMVAGSLMVSDEITISCEVELTNASQKELIMELEQTIDKEVMR